MKVIGYVRVSTEKQADEGSSLEAQRAKLAAYSVAMGLELVGVVTETASGRTLDRAGWRELVARIDAGEVKGVLVAKLDRLTRSVKDLGALLETTFAERGGIALLSVADSIDTRTAGGRLVLNVLTSVAQWERESISERTRDALAHLKREGVQLGGVPLGLRATDRRAVDGRMVWEVVPAELETIRFILAARAQELSLQRIGDHLNARGVLTKAGQPWSPKKIARVLAYGPRVLARIARGESSFAVNPEVTT